MLKIIVLNSNLKPRHKKQIEDAALGISAKVLFIENEKDITPEFADAQILYGFGTNTAKTSKDLKWLAVPSAGVDFLMHPGAFANEDCLLTNSSGAYGVSISEHMIAVTLMMMRKLTLVLEDDLKGIWGPQRPQRSIKDSRITVLGTGDIGRAFARRARAFEPKALIGVSRSGTCDDPCLDRTLKIEELDTILPSTDLLAMSLPDTSETRGIMSRRRLGLLPEGAFIVNVGRGSAIDEEALAELLESDQLAGAALDVFRTEPLPADSPLWKTKNLLITPHVAGNLTLEYTLDTNVSMFCRNLINYKEGKPLDNLIDRTKGY